MEIENLNKDLDTEGTLKHLANYVPLDERRQRRLLKDINAAPKRAPVQVIEDMSWEQFSAIKLRGPELPGVSADTGFTPTRGESAWPSIE